MKKYKVVLSVVLCVFLASSAAQGQAFSDDFGSGHSASDWDYGYMTASGGRMTVVNGAWETTNGPSFDWITVKNFNESTYQIDVDIDQSHGNAKSNGGSEAGIVIKAPSGEWWSLRHQSWNNGLVGFSRLETYVLNHPSVPNWTANFGPTISNFDYTIPWHLTVNVGPSGISATGTNNSGTLTFDLAYTPPASSVGIYPGGLGTRYDNFAVTPEPMTLSLLGLGGLVALRRKNRKNA